VAGPGVGRVLAERLGGFARFEQASLRQREPVVGLPLRRLEPSDGRARFVLSTIEAAELFFGLVLLPRELIGFLRQALLLVDGVLQLRVEADDGLFLLVMLGVQGGDRVGGVGDRGLERRRFLGEPDQRVEEAAARMPRDWAAPPPDTRCGPRNTSPSRVEIGSAVSRLAIAAAS